MSAFPSRPRKLNWSLNSVICYPMRRNATTIGEKQEEADVIESVIANPSGVAESTESVSIKT